MKVLLVRADSTPDDDARALADAGFDVTRDPYIEVATSTDDEAPARAHALLTALSAPAAWLVLTSAAGVRALAVLVGPAELTHALIAAESTGARFAAVGPTSARALAHHGVRDIHVPETAHTASALLASLWAVSPATAVLPRSSIGDTLVPQTLAARGWDVIAQVVYETTTVGQRPTTADALARGEFDAVVLRSPSAARAVAHFAGRLPESTAVIASGPTTALAASRLGLSVAAVSTDSRAASIVAAVS